MERAAIISEDGLYRYTLTRRWAGGPTACWVMLNPSTADATKDDPTTRKVIEFSKTWKMGAAVIVNLYAYRSSHPDVLLQVDDPCGPENINTLMREIALADMVIAAFGAAEIIKRVRRPVVERFAWEQNKAIWCLGHNKDGSPTHPRFVKPDTEPRIWRRYDG